jgi:glycosidase
VIRSKFVKLALALLVAALFAGRASSQPELDKLAKARLSQNNLVYEIFVRSFYYDGPSPGEKQPGNLKGIIKKLDSYLNDGDPKTTHDLEVGILWLMPIFPSPSYHGYDVTDYRNVNGDYGTLDDFRQLLKQAHARGVRIILDIPFNHTSDDHPWFKEALANKASSKRQFYLIEPDEGPRRGNWHPATGAGGEKLRYFGLFSSKMPDLNFNNPKVHEEVKAIAKFWLDLGVDGFRLDAAKHIFGDRFDNLREQEILKNNDWWHEFSLAVYQLNKDAIIVGEVLGDPEILRRHAYGLDGLLNEPFMNALRSQLDAPRPGFLGRYKQFITAARNVNRLGFARSLGIAPFEPFDYVASHDRNPRLMSDLEEMRRTGMQPEVDEAYRIALHTLMTLSARPILYEGDEVMQAGWKWTGNSPKDPNNPGDGSGIFDETLREPFPWYVKGAGLGQTAWFASKFARPDTASVEAQDKQGSMLDLTRGLSRLRSRHPTVANGEVGDILTDTNDWMVFEKLAGKDRYLVLLNLSGNDNSYNFHANWYPRYIGAQVVFRSEPKRKAWRDTTDDTQRIENTAIVPAYGMVVLRHSKGKGGP